MQNEVRTLNHWPDEKPIILTFVFGWRYASVCFCLLTSVFLFNPGLEIGHFWKNSNSRKLKTQAKNSNSSKKPSKTQAIKLNYGQFHSNYWSSLGKNISLLIKTTLYAKISNIFGSKFGIYLENSSSKLNFRQIHLVYLPKPGPISKPDLIRLAASKGHQLKKKLCTPGDGISWDSFGCRQGS